MNMQDPKYWQKLKSISSPEQNYFFRFAMRYPVAQIFKIEKMMPLYFLSEISKYVLQYCKVCKIADSFVKVQLLRKLNFKIVVNLTNKFDW